MKNQSLRQWFEKWSAKGYAEFIKDQKKKIWAHNIKILETLDEEETSLLNEATKFFGWESYENAQLEVVPESKGIFRSGFEGIEIEPSHVDPSNGFCYMKIKSGSFVKFHYSKD